SHPFRALVFGGSGAVGGAVCRAIAAEGARVAFTYRTGEKAALDLAKEIPESLALPLDLLSVRDIERTVDGVASSFGGLDAFVQCAGVAVTMECEGPRSHHRMPEVNEDAWDR